MRFRLRCVHQFGSHIFDTQKNSLVPMNVCAHLPQLLWETENETEGEMRGAIQPSLLFWYKLSVSYYFELTSHLKAIGGKRNTIALN